MGITNFTFGFALGFGSGIAFRALSERDFEPAREAIRTTVGLAQRVGDVALDTFGRLRESAEDMASRLRSERAKVVSRNESATQKKSRRRNVPPSRGVKAGAREPRPEPRDLRETREPRENREMRETRQRRSVNISRSRVLHA